MASNASDAEARTRTWDNLVNSEVLYHLSYFGLSPSSRVYLIGLSFSLHRVRHPFTHRSSILAQ